MPHQYLRAVLVLEGVVVDDLVRNYSVSDIVVVQEYSFRLLNIHHVGEAKSLPVDVVPF